jgi:hypothetical protein
MSRGFVSALGCALVTALTSGCAVMNTSVMDTAETIERGHVDVGAEYCLGLDLTTAVLLEDDTSEAFTAAGLAGSHTLGLRVGYGLFDNLELRARLWASIGGVGAALSGKYGLPMGGGGTSFAVAPGITAVATASEGDDNGSLEDWAADVSSFGVEIPFLVTYRLNEHVATTGVVRYSLDAIDIAFPEGSDLVELNGSFTLHRLGFVNGWTFELGLLYLQPEVGVELVSRVNGDLGPIPIFAFGGGLKF